MSKIQSAIEELPKLNFDEVKPVNSNEDSKNLTRKSYSAIENVTNSVIVDSKKEPLKKDKFVHYHFKRPYRGDFLIHYDWHPRLPHHSLPCLC